MPYHKKNFFLDFIVKMSGIFDEAIGKGEKDDAVGSFSPTKWMKMSESIGTVHWVSVVSLTTYSHHHWVPRNDTIVKEGKEIGHVYFHIVSTVMYKLFDRCAN